MVSISTSFKKQNTQVGSAVAPVLLVIAIISLFGAVILTNNPKEIGSSRAAYGGNAAPAAPKIVYRNRTNTANTGAGMSCDTICKAHPYYPNPQLAIGGTCDGTYYGSVAGKVRDSYVADGMNMCQTISGGSCGEVLNSPKSCCSYKIGGKCPVWAWETVRSLTCRCKYIVP